ncbi:MAG: protease, partial [Ktedonobacteraceae bacterium]
QGLNSNDQHILNGYRGLPDVAYNANPGDAILYYSSFGGQPTGYATIGGTSEGPPQWSGIIAVADQYAGEPLGFLNPMLYQLGISGQQNVYHDITVGNNSFAKIKGYNCTKGWDPVTGWGSPQATNLINALIQ